MPTQSERSCRARIGTRTRSAIVATIVLIFMTMSMTTVAASRDVSFGVPSWPGERVKAQVVNQILTAAGYDVSTKNVGWIVALKGVADNSLSADMALWRPSQSSVLDPMVESGKVKLVNVNLKDGLVGMVVPKYVWDAGVHSIADLQKYGKKLGYKIYGIEPGNDMNKIVRKAIKDDVYGLGKFKLIVSSTAGMMSEAKTAINQKKWIVFLGWKPHWMNVVWKLQYLQDPENIWLGGKSTVNTVVNPEFASTHPNITRFLSQMDVSAAVQSNWIYQYGFKKQPLADVATDWIKANPDDVKAWLDGVAMADGSSAAWLGVKKAIDAGTLKLPVK